MSWISLADFGKGLNLTQGPLDSTYAIDASDVTYGRAIQQRGGVIPLVNSSSQFSITYDKLHPWKNTTGASYLLASSGTDYAAALNPEGGVFATADSGFTDAESFGSPGNEVAYLAASNSENSILKWTGTEFEELEGQPKAKYLAIQSPDNRLVATGFAVGSNGPSSATVNESTVYFSNAGAPEEWTTNNYVHLTPGDGEKIQGVTAWRNLVIVFKETKFFVFYGNSTGPDGNPIFNFRQIDGAGLVAPKAIALAPNGVYFLSRSGMFVTNGGNPEPVMPAEMGPIFEADLPPFFTHGNISADHIQESSATYHAGRVYFSVVMNLAARTKYPVRRVIVVDINLGWWSIFTFNPVDLCVWEVDPAIGPEIVYAAYAGDGFIGKGGVFRHNDTLKSDDGQAIKASSRQAWFDAGTRCSIRQMRLWGDGKVGVSVHKDYEFEPTRPVRPVVEVDLRNAVVPWGSGLEGDAEWGGGLPEDWDWGPEALYRHRPARGFGTRGFVLSIAFYNVGEANTDFVIEQAAVEVVGNVNREQ